jgi:hypothetical protein
MTDFNHENESEDWSEFKPSPETGDLKVLNELIQRAADIEAGLKKLDSRTRTGKALLDDLLTNQIPAMFARCGLGKEGSITFNGITVTVKHSSFANVPSPSSIDSEKDDERRKELLDRRLKAMAILEEKAPTLIKRKYEIQFEKDQAEEALAFEQQLAEIPDAPPVVKGLSVHPATLSKWVAEKKSEGYNFNSEEEYAFGIYPKQVAKISR